MNKTNGFHAFPGEICYFVLLFMSNISEKCLRYYQFHLNILIYHLKFTQLLIAGVTYRVFKGTIKNCVNIIPQKRLLFLFLLNNLFNYNINTM